MNFDTAQVPSPGNSFPEPIRIYTGVLGQIGDIVMFTATARRIKELFPASEITFAVSNRYREAGLLVAGLPYVDRLFVTELYFEKMTDLVYGPWHLGWPVDLRGDDEVEEQRQHRVVLETRPRHRRMPWWHYAHQVAEYSHMVGVPGPIDLRTEICIPENTIVPANATGRIAIHNDPAIDSTKSWPWENVAEIVKNVGAEKVVLLGNPGPEIPGVFDLRGETSVAEAAAVIAASCCYIGIDSGLMWIAGSLQVPAVGLYGTSYIAAYRAIQPINHNAVYLQAEGSVSKITSSEVLRAMDEVEAKRVQAAS